MLRRSPGDPTLVEGETDLAEEVEAACSVRQHMCDVSNERVGMNAQLEAAVGRARVSLVENAGRLVRFDLGVARKNRWRRTSGRSCRRQAYGRHCR